MNKKRIDYIRDIIRYTTETTLIIPTTILNEKTIEPDNFKVLRESLSILQEDTGLNIIIEELEDDLTSIQITLNEETIEDEGE